MPLTAVVLVLAAAGIHAGWNLVVHGAEDRAAVMSVANLLGGLALVPWLVLNPPGRAVALFLAAGAAQAGYGLLLAAAYARGTLSIVYPVARGAAPLIVTLGAIVALSQVPGPGPAVGAACLAGGLIFLALAGRRAVAGTAVVLGLGTGCFIAAYSVLDARAVRSVQPVGYLAAEMLVGGTLMLAVTRLGSNPVGVARIRAALPTGALVALASTGAYLLVLFAFQRAAAGRVATLRELSVVIGIALARERPGRVVWAGAVLVVAGAILAGA